MTNADLNHLSRKGGMVAVLLGLAGLACAAPMDLTLTALPELESPKGYLELSSDHMNERLDFFKVRESDPKTVGTAAGDYHGQHLSAAVPVSNDLWLSGSLWNRTVSSASDTYHYDSYQLSGLYRARQGDGNSPALALRFSTWGNRSAATESSTPVTVPGAILNTVKVTSPADRSLQLDLIGSWTLQPGTVLNATLGAGRTQLSYGALSATTTRNGCSYNLAFNGNDIAGTLAPPCSATGGVIQQFYDSSGAYGVDVASEIAWRSSFVQAGGNLLWLGQPWSFRAGYMFQAVHRDAVDAILAARDKPVYRRNHNILLEADYRVRSHWQLFSRVQFNSNLFFNDIPVTYNSSTSERFGSKYSLFSVGTRYDF